SAFRAGPTEAAPMHDHALSSMRETAYAIDADPRAAHAARCPRSRNGLWLLLGWLFACAALGMPAPQAQAQEAVSPTFYYGTSSPPSNARATLSRDVELPQFRWRSSDAPLGDPPTARIPASSWALQSNAPARLLFRGRSKDASFTGDVLFSPY